MLKSIEIHRNPTKSCGGSLQKAWRAAFERVAAQWTADRKLSALEPAALGRSKAGLMMQAHADGLESEVLWIHTPPNGFCSLK